jgi:hypothetical protein
MEDTDLLDLDLNSGTDQKVRFDGVVYTITEPNLIQWQAIGKSLQKLSGLGGLVSETMQAIVGDEKDDVTAMARILQNADSLFAKLFGVLGDEFFDVLAETCVAVLSTKDNYLAWSAVHGGFDPDKHNKENKTRMWVGNTLFADHLRGKLNLRVASSVLRLAYERAGVFDALGKLLMRKESPTEA